MSAPVTFEHQDHFSRKCPTCGQLDFLTAIGRAAIAAGIWRPDPLHPLTAEGAAMLVQEFARLVSQLSPTTCEKTPFAE